jgi:hypothetical protein
MERRFAGNHCTRQGAAAADTGRLRDQEAEREAVHGARLLSDLATVDD